MENKNGLSVAVLAAAVIAALLCAVSLYFTVTLTGRISELAEGAEKLNEAVAGLAVTQPAEEIFILREYDGIIGVFDASGVLTDIIDVQVNSLPEADREMLETGIYAFSKSELNSLIEDYTG